MSTASDNDNQVRHTSSFEAQGFDSPYLMEQTLPVVLTKELREYAAALDVDLFGIAAVEGLNRNGRPGKRPQDLHQECTAVVVFGIGLLDSFCKVFNASPDPRIGENPKDALPYLHKKLLMAHLCSFLRRRGYAALDGESGSLEGIDEVRAFREAGLGYVGKSGNAISEKYGPRMVLGAILTNAPLLADAPYTDFRCGACTNCTEFCMSGNLMGDGFSDPRMCVALTGTSKGQLLYSVNGYAICDMCQRKCPQGAIKFPPEECRGSWWDIKHRHDASPLARCHESTEKEDKT